MNTNQLNCFVEVAKSLSFARAAEKLYISQPSVSNQISALENELGSRLFYRTKHKVELTSAGESFFRDAVEILNQQTMAVARARTRDSMFAEVLKVGYDWDVSIHRLPEILRQYHKAMPQVYVSNQLSGFEKERLLMDGHLDVGFSAIERVSAFHGLQFIPLFEGHFVCVLPKTHRLASRDSVTAKDLSKETHIFLSPVYCPPEMDVVQKQIQLTCPGITVYFSDCASIAGQMMLAGLGIAVMPNFGCPNDERLKAIPFETNQTINYGITYRKKDAPQKVLKFLHIVNQIY